MLRTVMPLVASIATRVYYRLEIGGGRVPRSGAVLLVANHTNMAMDPALVATAARRPVHFLAKATLFEQPVVRILLRAVGAIPIYRKTDDPSLLRQNEAVFRAVHAALGDGDAVGIFPEGKSHSDPALAPIKTGAARIALGAAASCGGSFPIIPVGLVFRRKEEFRSEALVVVGATIAWEDLSRRGPSDAEAVRELTRRIDEELRAVTVNLERWEDAPIVEAAEAIHAAEFGVAADPAERIERLRTTTEILRRLRAAGDPAWQALAADVAAHARLLHGFGLAPDDLRGRPRLSSAVPWSVRQLLFVGLPSVALGIVGQALFWPPYRLTAAVEARLQPSPDARSTVKLFAGAALHALWIALLVIATGLTAGPWAALGAALLLPVLALLVLRWQDRWSEAAAEARAFLVRRRQSALSATLAERQRALAERLDALVDARRQAAGSG